MENVSKILVVLTVLGAAKTNCQMPPQTETKLFHLDDSLMRFAHLRCLQQFPQAETANFTDSSETRCFLQCLLSKMGLMDLRTRGLDSVKFIDMWENMETVFEEDCCLELFDLCEPLNGSCNDTYRKLMQLRNNCFELFAYTFTINSTWKTEDNSKPIGQCASEYCDQLEDENLAASENSEYSDVSVLSRYKDKLKCIFENIHYLDAYGRVDETEIRLSFQEAGEDSADSQAAIHVCAHRANSKYQEDYLGHAVLELQKCLKSTLGPVYAKVFELRDVTSSQY